MALSFLTNSDKLLTMKALGLNHAYNQSVAQGKKKTLRVARACPLLLVAGFGRISPTRFRTRAVGQTGSRTVA